MRSLDMGDFSAEWLTLREPADRTARSSVGWMAPLIARLGAAQAARARPLDILDLGAGTGANVRLLAPLVPGAQRWCLVDRDVDLLRQVPKYLAAWALDRGAIVSGGVSSLTAMGPGLDCVVETRAADLSRLADDAVFGPLFQGRALVTASALLDLVSERWLETLANRCAAVEAAVLFALTYDGRMTCTPEDPDDEWIRSLVNRHQQTNKGFGRALGPDAVACAIRSFSAAGYVVTSAATDWILPPADAALQRALLEGWAAAAGELARVDQSRVREWLRHRLAHVEAGGSSLVVGHLDLAGWPR